MKKIFAFAAAFLVAFAADAQTISGATIRAGTTPLSALQAQATGTAVCNPAGGSSASPVACTAAQMRLALALGTAALSNVGDFDAAGAATAAQAAAVQRANHTGTQLASTISNFSTAADARVAAAVGVSVDAFGAAAAAQAASQPLDATLTALAAANWAANALPIGTGADTLSQTSFAASTFPARASTGNLVAKTLTDYALSLLDDIDASAARTTLGLSTAAVEATGTSGHTIGFLDGVNTWSGMNVWSSSSNFGDGTGGISLRLNGASGNSSFLAFQVAGVNRWRLQREATTLDFALRAEDAAGTLIDEPVRIVNAAGGLMSLSRPTTVAGLLTASAGLSGPFLTATGNRSVATIVSAGGVAFNTVASTYTDTASSGSTGGNFGVNTFATPTLAASSVTTFSGRAATVLIAGAPTAGTNVTLSAARSLYVASGTTETAALTSTGNTSILNNGGSGTTNIGTGSTAGAVTIGGGSNTITVGSPEAHSGSYTFSNSTNGGQAISTAAATYTDAVLTGSQAANFGVTQFGIPTLAAGSALTYTGTSATVTIKGAPVSGTNVTQSFSRALSVEAGSTVLGGGVVVQSGLIATGNSTIAANNGTATVGLGTGTTTGTVSIGGGSNVVNVASPLQLGGKVALSTTAPTISSGFGTSPSIVASSGTAAFTLNVGTGGAASTGIVGLPAATTGWACSVNNLTTNDATHLLTKQTATTTTTVTVGNYTTAGVAGAWAASDILQFQCTGY